MFFLQALNELTSCTCGCTGLILSGKGLACLAHHCPPEHDTVYDTIGDTIIIEWRLTSNRIFHFVSAHSWGSTGLPVLQNTVSELGFDTEGKGTFLLSCFPQIPLSLCCDLCQHLKQAFSWENWSRTGESLVFLLWRGARLCLKEPPLFLEELAQATAARRASTPPRPWDTSSWDGAVSNWVWDGEMDFINFRLSLIWASTHKGKIIWFRNLIPSKLHCLWTLICK